MNMYFIATEKLNIRTWDIFSRQQRFVTVHCFIVINQITFL
jgi:hypothetical protein